MTKTLKTNLQIKTATNKRNKLTTKRCKWWQRNSKRLQKHETIRKGCKTASDTRKAQRQKNCPQNILAATKRLKMTTKRENDHNSHSGGSSWICGRFFHSGANCVTICPCLHLYSVFASVSVKPVTRLISQSHRDKRETERAESRVSGEKGRKWDKRQRQTEREMDNEERQSRIFHTSHNVSFLLSDSWFWDSTQGRQIDRLFFISHAFPPQLLQL